MESENQDLVTQLLASVLAREPAQRAAFLEEACAGDSALRREVESLLLSHEQAGSFLEIPPLEIASEVLAAERRNSRVGERIGPFQIESLAGSGGMGEIYRARDMRLDRTVAIKFLPARVSRDPELRLRLEREARAISRLNHRNICILYDIGRYEDVDYLVMEHLEGETLEDRLARGALPLRDVLRYAIEIADALQTAHRQGVIHRDIKPGNIMLVRDGCKLLDFGLAKLNATSASPAAPLAIPTASSGITEKGTLLGTVQYMAPEQIEGNQVDGRTDIFSFGGVLYEMVTGRKAFAGKSQASLIASIISSDPPSISELQPMLPSALDHVVRRCLAKDPEERWQTALDVKKELQWILDSDFEPRELRKPRQSLFTINRREWILMAAGGAATLTTAILLSPRKDVSPLLQPVRLPIEPPAGATWAELVYGGPAISPDGTRIVYSATREGQTQLYVHLLKTLENVEPRPLPGTEGGYHPFWKPDSRAIGFFANGVLKTLSVLDGSLRELCAVDKLRTDNQGKGGAWNNHGDIVFATTRTEPLYRVSDRGGPSHRITELDGAEESHRWPCFLPDGQRFLYHARQGTGNVYVGSLRSKEKSRILPDHDSSVIYASGHLLYASDGYMMARRFDAGTLKEKGDATRVAPVTVFTRNNRAFFSASNEGTIVLRNRDVNHRQVVQFDSSGAKRRVVGDTRSYETIRLSPDGQKLAYKLMWSSGALPPSTLGILDMKNGNWEADTRIFHTSGPVFSPDGRQIFFSGRPSSGNEGAKRIYRTIYDDPDSIEPFLHDEGFHLNPLDVSRDGRFLLVEAWPYRVRGARFQMWHVELTPAGTRGRLTVAKERPFNEGSGRFSPNGRWLAFTSNEQGRTEIYVREFPGGEKRTRISGKEGGISPVWHSDGNKIVYLAPGGTLMFVSLTFGSSVTGTPSGSVRVPPDSVDEIGGGIGGYNRRWWDMSPDGRTFYMVVDNSILETAVITNWTAAVQS